MKTCGMGTQTRNRSIAQPAPGGLEGCRGALQEMRPCQVQPCGEAVDCRWGEWQQWGDCTPSPDMCGVGFKRRQRVIDVLPKDGGQLCPPRARQEVVPVVNCKGQPQCCINGEWADWESWGTCSATCGLGSKRRHRKLMVKETWCGDPAPGSDVEYSSCLASNKCDTDRDCVFGDWPRPSPCSADCHGSRTRTRQISSNSTGGGKPCEGAVELTERCNPAEGQQEPFSCEAGGRDVNRHDCVMAEWSDWSSCTATCEMGYQTRFRHVRTRPRNGGRECPAATHEIASCHVGTTCFPGRVDCAWAVWRSWGECSSHGERMRSRGYRQRASGGGLACQGSAKEVSTCEVPATCQTSQHFCYWGEWTDWSECSTTCGAGGTRQRQRRLELKNGSDAILKMESDFVLPYGEDKVRGVASHQHWEGWAMAFAIGLGYLVLAVFAAYGTLRAFDSRAGCWWESRQLRYEYDAIPMAP